MTEANEGAPPEGGLRAYLVLAAASTVMALSFGMCNSYGVYQTHYESMYPDVGSNVISIIGCLQVALTFLLAVPSTMGMHWLGPQAMVLLGGTMASLGFMLLSLTGGIWQVFLAQGVLFGIGSGVMYVHATGVTFQYFEKRKALAQGVITAGASLGGVYWPIGARNLIDKLGFAWGNRIIGFIYLPMVAFAVVFLRPRSVASGKSKSNSGGVKRVNFGVVLRDRQFVVICFAWITFMMSLFPGMFYIDLFCTRAGVAGGFQKYSVAIVNATAMVSRVTSGVIADSYGRINMVIPPLLLTGILPLAMWMKADGGG